MADAYIQVAPDSTGAKVQTYENSVDGNTVEAQAVVLVDSTGAPINLPSFLSSEVARVDPSGNDSAGVVGDMSKPFLTVQGAIDAIEGGSFTYPVIQIGNYSDISGTVTTSLTGNLTFVGVDMSPGLQSYLCANLVFSATSGSMTIVFHNCAVTTAISFNTSGTVNIGLTDGKLPPLTQTGTGFVVVRGSGLGGGGNTNLVDSIHTTTAGLIFLFDVTTDEIDCAGKNVFLTRVLVDGDVTAAGTLTLTDSRVLGTNSASSTVYSDQMLKGIGDGGLSGQFQRKASDEDFDVEWVDLPFNPADLTDDGTDGITITGGTGAVNGSGTSIAQHVADASNNGYLSATDWGTFNGKQDHSSNLDDWSALATSAKVTANAGITGATKTKVTYDTKGLVTSGTDATTADVADSSNKRYVTDAQLTVIGNTSGTNTGDQDLSGLVPKTTTVNTKPLSSNVALTTADVPDSTDKRYVTDANLTVLGNTSGVNSGDQTLPVKASGAELDTGTDDAKFATAKALKDSHNIPSVAPGTNGNVLTSDGTDWTSAALPGGVTVATGAELDTGTDNAKFASALALKNSHNVPSVAPGTSGNTMKSDGTDWTSGRLTYANIDAGVTGGTLTLAENTSIALDPAGSADGKYSGITVAGTGGATIAFGDLVTLDKDDSRWELVDISVAAAATGDARGILGMAVTSSSDGGALTVLLHGIIRADANFPALTIGAPVYASTTGDVVVAQPTTTDYVIRIIGYGLTADEMYFNPDCGWITHT